MTITTSLRTVQPFILDDTYVHRDTQGRYSLNDLHKAANGEARHKPSNWLRLEQTQALIAELEQDFRSDAPPTAGIPGVGGGIAAARFPDLMNHSSDLSNLGEPVPMNHFSDLRSDSRPGASIHVINGGTAPGTYACRELVYAYAMWISPAFHLKVIRTFDAIITAIRPAPTSAPVGRATGLTATHLIGLQNQWWHLVTRLRCETTRAVRAGLHAQLVAISGDLGHPAPPLADIGQEEPDEPEAVIRFWMAYRDLVSQGIPLNHHRNPELIAVNLPQVLAAARSHSVPMAAPSALQAALRLSRRPQFIDASRPVNSGTLGHSIRCWIFRKPSPAIATREEV